MSIKGMDVSELGAHHCTRENISCAIARLKEIEATPELIATEDWVANCGTYALQMQWLLSLLDN